MKKKLSGMIAAAILFSISLNSFSASAEDDNNIAVTINPNGTSLVQISDFTNQDSNLIVGFENNINPYSTLHYSNSNKPSLSALLSEMPKSIKCVMANGDIKKVPVVWNCVADDYENSPYYYFQFNPTFDESGYSVSETVSFMPYISVFLDSVDISFYSVTSNSNETIIYNFLINEMGCNTATAVGILANIQRESSFNPNSQYTESDGRISYGICQWNGGRFSSLKQHCADNGLNYTTIEGQLSYLKFELLHTYENYAWKKMQGIENTAQGAYIAAYRWAQYFERCAHYYNGRDQYATRGNLARDTYWPAYAGDAVCTCSDEYAGNYICCNAEGGLRIRSGHGTAFEQIGLIPEGALVYVSKSNGTWAHVEYNGISGYSHMNYLRKHITPKIIASNTYIDIKEGESAVVSLTLEGDKPYGLNIASKSGIVSKAEWANDDEPEVAYLVITSGYGEGSGTVKIDLVDLNTSEIVSTLNISVSTFKADRYNIWMVLGYGNIDSEETIELSQWKSPGVPYKIPINIIPQRFGYSFKGWGNTLSSTISPNLPAVYMPGEYYAEDKDITLYATWKSPVAISSGFFPTKNYFAKIEFPNNCEYYAFTPSVTDEYIIKSVGTYDTYGELYSISYKNDDDKKWFPEGVLLASNDDSNDTNGGTNNDRSRYSKNFSIKYKLNAGETYFIKVKMSQKTDTGSFSVLIDKASHTVSFNANGGLKAPPSQIKEYDKDLTLNYNNDDTYANIPVRDGYTFVGWSLSPDSLTPDYLPGEIITSEENIELYAIWEKKICYPPFIEAKVSDNDVTVSWDAVDDADGYKIYYVKDNITTEYETTTDTTSTIRNLPNGKYKIYVKSLNGTDLSDKSNIVDIDIGSLIGDFNNDGNVDLKDLAIMKSILAEDDTAQYVDSADLNGDGKVDLKDLAALKYYLAEN